MKIKLPKKTIVGGLLALVGMGVVAGTAKFPVAAPFILGLGEYLKALISDPQFLAGGGLTGAGIVLAYLDESPSEQLKA